MKTLDQTPAPLSLFQCDVKPEWLDRHGHMNMAYYALAFTLATGALSDFLGFTRAHKDATNTANFAANMNISYFREVRSGDVLQFRSRILGCDPKRVHFWHEMRPVGKDDIAATCEMLSLHIDKSTRRVAPMDAGIYARITELRDLHSALPRPEGQGRVIGVG